MAIYALKIYNFADIVEEKLGLIWLLIIEITDDTI